MKIYRERWIRRVEEALERSRSVALVGPRQCGKSTLARELVAGRQEAHFFDLEDPTDLARLADPKLALEPLRGLVVIDEVQRMPELMPLLRVLLDRDTLPARFLLLGSASPEVIRGGSESLAGRIEFIELQGFDLWEIGTEQQRRLWLRGGFPRSYLPETDGDSFRWRQAFVQAFVERDLRMLGVDLPPREARRWLQMLAHVHGQSWNASEIARSMQVTHPTAKRVVTLLEGSLWLRMLPPWHENLGKRLVKSPKVYYRDSGMFHQMLGLSTWEELEGHPKLGASWEGFALEQVLGHWEGGEPYFWATHGGAELDLLLMAGGRRLGVECKYSSAPAMTRSMHIARQDLRLDALLVVVPGSVGFPLADAVWACPLRDVRQKMEELGFSKECKGVPS